MQHTMTKVQYNRAPAV